MLEKFFESLASRLGYRVVQVELLCKVRSLIPWLYAGFYTMYYCMILTAILQWKFDVDKHIYLASIRFGTLQYLCYTLYKSQRILAVMGILL
jgi:hypothetical protein